MTVGRPGQSTTMRVSLVNEWHAGSIKEPVMSNSSGPKDYFKNDLFTLFEKGAQRVRLLRSDEHGKNWGSLVLILCGDDGVWTDVTGAPVEVRE